MFEAAALFVASHFVFLSRLSVLSQRLSASQFSQAMSKETFSAHFFDESKTSCKRAAISKHAVSSKSLFPGLPII